MGLNKMSNADAEQLLLLLNTGSYKHAQHVKSAKAACLIQACWRSYRTRCQLKQADTAISRFQRTFRQKKEQEERRREQEKMCADLEHMLNVRRRYTIRQLHQRQLCTLEILPASEIGKHLANEQQRAAIHIQAAWKGYRVRHHIGNKRNAVRQTRAAILIQRMVRKWLDKIHVKKEQPVRWQRPAGLTDDRRIELQAKIQEWRESHQVEPRSRMMQEELHQRTQDILKSHVIGAQAIHKHHLHREALMARIEMDTSLLLNAPRLCDVSDDIDVILRTFVCRSAPVAARARLDHAAELRLLEQPWWRKLGDEYQDSRSALDDDDDNSWKVF
jgi:IQ calmodulin-binding motif-containing protein 1